MERPEGCIERWVRKARTLTTVLVVLVWIAATIYMTALLGPLSQWYRAGIMLVIGLCIYTFWHLMFAVAHRLEFPWWYRKSHMRESVPFIDTKNNRWQVTRRLWSYDEMHRRRSKLPLVNPDRQD